MLSQLLGRGFLVFVIYESIAMLIALAIYVFLTIKRKLEGARAVALAIVLNLIAAAVQATDITIQFVWPFDHNGVFHLVQMVAIVVLVFGLRVGLAIGAPRAA